MCVCFSKNKKKIRCCVLMAYSKVCVKLHNPNIIGPRITFLFSFFFFFFPVLVSDSLINYPSKVRPSVAYSQKIELGQLGFLLFAFGALLFTFLGIKFECGGLVISIQYKPNRTCASDILYSCRLFFKKKKKSFGSV